MVPCFVREYCFFEILNFDLASDIFHTAHSTSHLKGYATDPAKDQTFSAKIITDINLGYRISPTATFGLTVQNLLDIYPDEVNAKGDPITNLGGRFKYAWEVNQFGYLGTVISARISLKFS